MSGNRAPIFGALAVVGCCAAGSLIAAGALAAMGGAIARFWPLLLAGAVVAAYGISKRLTRSDRSHQRRVP